MKGGIFWIRTIKCAAICRRHIFCIAIDIKEFKATRVFVNNFISTVYGLKGRKVMPRILKKPKR